jgi:class 3 adenylate cyclase
VTGEATKAPAPNADDLDTLLLGAPRRWTRDQVAEKAGVPLERARRFWRALGFADTEGAPAFTDRDVDALRRLDGLVVSGLVSEDLAIALLRALGHTTGRLAVWQVDLVMDALSGGTGLREGLDTRRAYRLAERLVPEMEPLLVHVWRLQLAATADRVIEDDATLVDAVHITVGFADLVGFTRLSRRLEQRELAAVVERFEEGALDVVTAAGARLVKTLGDEVLWIAERSESAVDAGLDLVDAFLEDEQVPELRVGLATGLVISRMGDVFGTTVNRASRLTSLARPGSVLVDKTTAEELEAADPDGDGEVVVSALWPRPLRGLGLVEPYLVSRRTRRPSG